MKKITLLALLSVALFSTRISHAMNPDLVQEGEFLSQDAEEQGGQEDEQYSGGSDGSDSGSDSEFTDSGSDSNLEPEEESPLDKYKNQLRNLEISYGHKPLNCLHAIIMQPKPDDQAMHEEAYKSLTYRIVKMLVKIKDAGANPNKINPDTGNAALADLFINHHANNGYLVAIVESMAEYGACLENITRDQSDLRHLVQKAILRASLRLEHYDGLLESKTHAVAEHFKAERVQQQSLRQMQARAKANRVRQESLRKKQDRAHKRAVKRNLERRPNLSVVPEETAQNLD